MCRGGSRITKDTAPDFSLLILSARPEDPRTLSEDEERFGRFAALLSRHGMVAEHRVCASLGDLEAALADLRPTLVFSAAHELCDECGSPHSVHVRFEELGQAYVGSSPETIACALSKPALKERWQSQGVLTPAYAFGRIGEGGSLAWQPAPLEVAGFPLFLKPAREGNSRGICADCVVRDRESLEAKAGELAARYGEILAEAFLDGPDRREFTVAQIGTGRAALILPAEIVFKEPVRLKIITGADKDGHRTLATAVPMGALRDRLVAFARKAFAVAGVRDYARGDFIMLGDELYAIEVNGQPMMPDRWFAACASGAGLDEEGYLLATVLAAAQRLASEGRLRRSPPQDAWAALPAAVRERILG